VPVTLSEPSIEPVFVEWSGVVASTSAFPGSQAEPARDYDVPVHGNITFAPGETKAAAVVSVWGDTQPEADEAVFTCFCNATSAALAPGSWGIGGGTILNDD
jgi:hypothetical protein